MNAFNGIIDAAVDRSAQSKLLPVNRSRVVVAAEPLENDSRRRSADFFYQRGMAFHRVKVIIT
jgi:hypothetical protein